MTARAIVLLVLAGAIASGCDLRQPSTDSDAAALPTPAAQAGIAPDPSVGQVYVCPMDKDVRSYEPGTCSRCGMTLVTTIPEPVEYRLHLATDRPPSPGVATRLAFQVFDPWKGNRVTRFGIVHEKLFHAFIVSRDLQFFMHDHPVWQEGSFHDEVVFPKPGLYRILGDFYPEAATPQLLTQSVFVAGEEMPPPVLTRDYSAKQDRNLNIAISTNPPDPVVGEPTQVRATLSPGDNIQRLLGAWGHLIAASDDVIDMMHEHPLLADGGPEMQFSLIFPRPRLYRIWLQFQRAGVVNTAHFDVPVGPSTGGAP